MATIARSHNRPTGRTLSDAVQGVSLRIAEYRAAARERRRITRELSTYSDDELGELGFSRFDIPAIAAGTYRR